MYLPAVVLLFQAINDDLQSLGVPVELVDGFVDCISVSIPWSALIQDSTKLEVSGLELTLQPKEREDNGMVAGEMFSSMQSSMTTSLQLAKDCLESETEKPQKSEPIEGVQKFASMIDSGELRWLVEGFIAEKSDFHLKIIRVSS